MPFDCLCDNYTFYEAHEREQAKQEAKLPHCADCDQPIQQDTAVYFNDEWLCDDCLSSYRREVCDI